MKTSRVGLVLAVREHLAEGHPITHLDALTLFGVPSLTKVISDLRREGWIVKSRAVPYLSAVARINKSAVFTPPSNLPVADIYLTEYWVSK